MKLAPERDAPEAKAKVRLRHRAGIKKFQAWVARQENTTRAQRVEMFDFFIDTTKAQ